MLLAATKVFKSFYSALVSTLCALLLQFKLLMSHCGALNKQNGEEPKSNK